MKMNRWNVTYTKQIKQKRKVYQDGILELSGDKVALYDDCEKLIDNRFLKKDEVIECGGTLAFDTHLVDIGVPDVSDMLNVPGEDVKLKERAGAQGQRPFYLGNKKSTLQSLSSKDLSNAVHGSNRVSKQSKQYRDEALQHCPDEEQTTLKEWDALYTTQITQKYKRYHDGILRLVSCGLHMNQVILLNEGGTVLDSKYLKSVECVETGCDYEFSNHLVQICEPRALLGDDSHGGSLQHVAGSRSTGMDKLMSKQKVISIKSTPNEWNALYTTQKTQKAKKYHDGILQLVNRGSHMKQVILLNDEGVVLSSMYLKSVENVKAGQTCEFPNYLVEICAGRTPAGDDPPKQSLEVPGSISTGTGNFNPTRNDYSDKSLLKDVQKGHSEEATSGINSDSRRSTSLNNRPIRDASKILSSLKRPVHALQSSEIILLDVENENKMPEVNARKLIEDDHTGIGIVVDSDCKGKPPPQECSISSNWLSREVAPEISPTKLDTECTLIKNEIPTSSIGWHDFSDINACISATIAQTNSSHGTVHCDIFSYKQVDNMRTNKIASSSTPGDHINANKDRSLTDEIMALQQEWAALSYRASAIGNIKNPVSFAENDGHADNIHPSDASSPLCVATDARSENSEFQSISKTCLNVDEFPTFDLCFD